MAEERVDIRDLADTYVICRTLGHSWEDNPKGQVNAALARIATGVLVLRCVRCGSERIDYIGKDLGVETRWYRYPQHYTTIVGQGKRPNLRGEMLRRSLLIRSAHRRRNGKR